MKEKLFRGIGTILIIIGVVILGTTFYEKYETNKKQQQLLNIFEEEDTLQEDKTEETEETEEDFNIDTPNFTPIALIEIPSINFSQAVVEGVSNEAIKYYIGHFEDSAMPGEVGNFAVAAHNTSRYSDAFKNLHKLVSGDEVILESKDKKFIYEVKENFIVNPEQVEVLDDTDTATITLITCTIGGKQRVVVKGELKETKIKE